MLPRFRYDQLMDLGWRRFVPIALANIVLYAVILWARAVF
jgi:NADH-quinone oxidoreductase subunit H